MAAELRLAVAHAPEADDRDVETRGTELHVLHCAPLARRALTGTLPSTAAPVAAVREIAAYARPPWGLRCAAGGASSTSETATCSGFADGVFTMTEGFMNVPGFQVPFEDERGNAEFPVGSFLVPGDRRC